MEKVKSRGVGEGVGGGAARRGGEGRGWSGYSKHNFSFRLMLMLTPVTHGELISEHRQCRVTLNSV